MSELSFSTEAVFESTSGEKSDDLTVTIRQDAEGIVIGTSRVKGKPEISENEVRFSLKTGGAYIVSEGHMPTEQRIEMFQQLGGELPQ